MRRGWEVEYVDGSILREDQNEWRSIPKKNIKRLTLHYDGRRWDIEDKLAYTQKKQGSMIPGIAESFMVESRSIGYYENDCKVWYTVNEASGKMKISIEEIK